jgi:hypothetical protein
VVRGGPVKRTRDVRVRLTPAEHAAWTAARQTAGRRELGAWVRDAVNELLALPPGERGRGGQAAVDEGQAVDVEVYQALVKVGNNLNQLARWANTERRYPAERAAAAAYEQVRTAVAEARAAIIAARRRRR